jgi:hypothetical protein
MMFSTSSGIAIDMPSTALGAVYDRPSLKGFDEMFGRNWKNGRS